MRSVSDGNMKGNTKVRNPEWEEEVQPEWDKLLDELVPSANISNQKDTVSNPGSTDANNHDKIPAPETTILGPDDAQPEETPLNSGKPYVNEKQKKAEGYDRHGSVCTRPKRTTRKLDRYGHNICDQVNSMYESPTYPRNKSNISTSDRKNVDRERENIRRCST